MCLWLVPNPFFFLWYHVSNLLYIVVHLSFQLYSFFSNVNANFHVLGWRNLDVITWNTLPLHGFK